MLAPGTLLAGRYEIVGRIGAGGMSNVYKAKDQKLNRYVAIKVLKPEYSTDATFVKKFRVEAQSAAGLSHPNIVNVYDVGEEKGIHYIVMELVQGITLKHYIERKGQLDIREVLNISVQIASGMGAAHANRIIHRDIKPQNVIMSRDGKVKVTDFGIAKAADSTTVTTNAAGSVHYISPEQARGGYSDEKSDIYSLGITMYEMVTGEVPYDGENNVAVALQHIQGNMTSPRQINPDIPRSVEHIILKCTQKKPDLRYNSAKELIMDLRRALAEPDGNYVVIGAAAAAGAAGVAAGVGDSTTVVMDEQDVEKLRQAGLNKKGPKAGEKLTAEERRRRQLEEEEREYEEYDDHHARKKAKRQEVVSKQDDDDDDDVNPALDKTMMIFGIVGAVIIVIVIFFIIGRASGLFGGTNTTKATETSSGNISTESSQVTVPDCSDMTQEAAIALLEENELDYKVQEKEDDSVDKGKVINQTPEANAKVDKGTIITLFISKGNESAEMPDLKEMSLDAAKSQLEGMGLKVKVTNEFHDTIEENHVIRTSPETGKTVKLGATVTLYVSKGKETKTVTVPDLSPYTYDEAVYALNSVGLKVGDVSEEYSDYVDENYVTWQGVDAGSEVAEGTTVNFGISKGQRITEPVQGSATVSMPGDNPIGRDIGTHAPFTEGTITIEVAYADGTVETVYTAYCSSADSYESGWSTSVTGIAGESATVYAYIEGVLYSNPPAVITFN